MPPKKAAAETKTTKAKATATKRKATKDETELEVKEKEVVEKKAKPKPAKKQKEPKENVESKKEVKAEPKKRAAKGAAKKEKEESNEAPETNGTTKKKAAPKPKKAKSEKTETEEEVAAPKASKAKAKKAPAKKAPVKKSTRAKKVEQDAEENSEEEEESPQKEEESEQKSEEEAEQKSEEESSEPKVSRKRKAAPKAARNAKKDEPETKTARVNASATDWSKIDFNCTNKNSNGEVPNLHITSWNVDGLRAWLKKGGLEILEYAKPDIFCIQETKCSDDKLPEEVAKIDGYETYWCASDKDGYAGVGIITKVKPISVEYGIKSEEHDNEGRCITTEFEKFYLINVYVPNAGRKLVTLPKRLEWNKAFKDYVKSLNEKKPVIITGDMNVAHNEIDLANPKTNTKNAGFTPEEREGLTEFLNEGFVDTYRKLYPDKEKAYTFWTYMANARNKNVGWRLDYFIVSEKIMENVCDNIIHSEVLGSDHCPISLFVNI